VIAAILANKQIKNLKIIVGPEIGSGLDLEVALKAAKFVSQIAEVVHLLVNLLYNFSIEIGFKFIDVRLNQRGVTKLLGFEKNHTAARDCSR